MRDFEVYDAFFFFFYIIIITIFDRFILGLFIKQIKELNNRNRKAFLITRLMMLIIEGGLMILFLTILRHIDTYANIKRTLYATISYIVAGIIIIVSTVVEGFIYKKVFVDEKYNGISLALKVRIINFLAWFIIINYY